MSYKKKREMIIYPLRLTLVTAPGKLLVKVTGDLQPSSYLPIST